MTKVTGKTVYVFCANNVFMLCVKERIDSKHGKGHKGLNIKRSLEKGGESSFGLLLQPFFYY